MRALEPNTLEVATNTFDSSSVEDTSFLHEYRRVEQVENLRGRLMNSAQNGGITVGYFLEDCDETEGGVRVCTMM